MLGAERVIAIDRFDTGLQMARDGGAEPSTTNRSTVVETLKDMTRASVPTP